MKNNENRSINRRERKDGRDKRNHDNGWKKMTKGGLPGLSVVISLFVIFAFFAVDSNGLLTALHVRSSAPSADDLLLLFPVVPVCPVVILFAARRESRPPPRKPRSVGRLKRGQGLVAAMPR
jgi:hypothetical protein